MWICFPYWCIVIQMDLCWKSLILTTWYPSRTWYKMVQLFIPNKHAKFYGMYPIQRLAWKRNIQHAWKHTYRKTQNYTVIHKLLYYSKYLMAFTTNTQLLYQLHKFAFGNLTHLSCVFSDLWRTLQYSNSYHSPIVIFHSDNCCSLYLCIKNDNQKCYPLKTFLE